MFDKTSDGVEQAVPFRPGIARGGWRRTRDSPGEQRHDAGELTTEGADVRVEQRPGYEGDEIGERVDERAERQPGFGIGPTEGHDAAIEQRPSGELGREPRLADTGVAADEHHLATTAAGLPERVYEQLEVGASSSERGARRSKRHRQHRPPPPTTGGHCGFIQRCIGLLGVDELERFLTLGNVLQLQQPDSDERECFGQPIPHQIGG